MYRHAFSHYILVCLLRSLQVAGAFSSSKPIALPACGAHDFQLHHIAQVFKVGTRNLALLGEPSKWVPIAARRIARVTVRKSFTRDFRKKFELILELMRCVL